MPPMMPPPSAKKPESTVAIGIEAQPKAPTEGEFKCPSCGAGLRCEPVEESDMEHEALGEA